MRLRETTGMLTNHLQCALISSFAGMWRHLPAQQIDEFPRAMHDSARSPSPRDMTYSLGVFPVSRFSYFEANVVTLTNLIRSSGEKTL
jgi:hypothetical protein